jgi:hypothetical protein
MADELVKVKAGAERLINLGNYENVKLIVGIEIPCPFSDHEETYEYAKQFTLNRLDDVVEEALLQARRKAE